MEENAGRLEVEASGDSVTGRTIGNANQQSSSFTSGAATALSSASPVQPKTQNEEEFVTVGKDPEETTAATDPAIAAEVAEYLAENTARRAAVRAACSALLAATGPGYSRLVARTVRTRRPRAQMFTVDPHKEIAWCRTPKVRLAQGVFPHFCLYRHS